MLPLTYVLRNIRRRRLRTGLTIAGIALVVAVYFLMGSVAETMVKSFRSTGQPNMLQKTPISRFGFGSTAKRACTKSG